MSTPQKDFKYYHLLNLINRFGPVSRTRLAEITDYRSGTIGEMVKDMLDTGLVTETGHASAGRGRSRSLLELNHTGLCSIGISFSSDKIHIAAVLANGTIFSKEEIGISERESKELIIQKTADACKRILSHIHGIIMIGIGLAVPSYDPAKHLEESLAYSYRHHSDWIRINLKAFLEQSLGCPVYVFSSIGLPGLVEYHYGAARYTKTFICVELSNGIGSSIIINGKALSGLNGTAGSLGHTVVEYSHDTPVICNCGKANCIEATSAWPAVKRELMAAMERGVYSMLNPIYKEKRDFRASDVGACIKSGDQLCRSIVKGAAERIGVAVANEINLLNPEKVIFHSFMLELGPFFTECIAESIKDNVLSLVTGTELIFSDNYETLRPNGAAAEVLSTYLKITEFNWVYQMPVDLMGTDFEQ